MMAYTYELTADPHIIRRSDDAWIPDDPENVDYQAYLAWIAEGNVAAAYVPPPAPEPVPLEEKLAAAGIDVNELKTLLGVA